MRYWLLITLPFITIFLGSLIYDITFRHNLTENIKNAEAQCVPAGIPIVTDCRNIGGVENSLCPANFVMGGYSQGIQGDDGYFASGICCQLAM